MGGPGRRPRRGLPAGIDRALLRRLGPVDAVHGHAPAGPARTGGVLRFSPGGLLGQPRGAPPRARRRAVRRFRRLGEAAMRLSAGTPGRIGQGSGPGLSRSPIAAGVGGVPASRAIAVVLLRGRPCGSGGCRVALAPLGDIVVADLGRAAGARRPPAPAPRSRDRGHRRRRRPPRPPPCGCSGRTWWRSCSDRLALLPPSSSRPAPPTTSARAPTWRCAGGLLLVTGFWMSLGRDRPRGRAAGRTGGAAGGHGARALQRARTAPFAAILGIVGVAVVVTSALAIAYGTLALGAVVGGAPGRAGHGRRGAGGLVLLAAIGGVGAWV